MQPDARSPAGGCRPLPESLPVSALSRPGAGGSRRGPGRAPVRRRVAHRGAPLPPRHRRRFGAGLHPLPGRLPDTRPARRRPHRHGGQPGAEPVHHRARLALRRGRLHHPDGAGLSRPRALPAAPKRALGMKRWLGIYAVAFFAFLHLPLVTLACFSFNSSRFTKWEHFSLVWYRAMLRDPQILEGTWNSVVIALWATVLSTVIGTLCA